MSADSGGIAEQHEDGGLRNMNAGGCRWWRSYTMHAPTFLQHQLLLRQCQRQRHVE